MGGCVVSCLPPSGCPTVLLHPEGVTPTSPGSRQRTLGNGNARDSLTPKGLHNETPFRPQYNRRTDCCNPFFCNAFDVNRLHFMLLTRPVRRSPRFFA